MREAKLGLSSNISTKEKYHIVTTEIMTQTGSQMQIQLLSKNNLKVPNTIFPEEAFSKNFLLFGAFVKASEVVLLI